MSWQLAGTVLTHRRHMWNEPPQLSSLCLSSRYEAPSQLRFASRHARSCQLHTDKSKAHLLDHGASLEVGRVCSTATTLSLGQLHPEGDGGCPTAVSLRRSREGLVACARLLLPVGFARQLGACLVPMAQRGCQVCCSSAKLEGSLQTLCRGAAAGCGLCPRTMQGRNQALAPCLLCSWRTSQDPSWLPMQGWNGALPASNTSSSCAHLPQALPGQSRGAALPC